MTDTASPAPISAPIQPPTTTPSAPGAPSAPKPGYATSEAWIAFLVALPGVILNSGLVANAPLATKLVSLAASVLVALGYGSNRTNLKRAHLALAAGLSPAQGNGKIAVTAGAAGVLLVALIAWGIIDSSKIIAAPQAISHAAPTIPPEPAHALMCTTPHPGLLQIAEKDLASDDYANLVEGHSRLAGDIGCAMRAIEADTTTTAIIKARAAEMIDRHHWGLRIGGAP